VFHASFHWAREPPFGSYMCTFMYLCAERKIVPDATVRACFWWRLVLSAPCEEVVQVEVWFVQVGLCEVIILRGLVSTGADLFLRVRVRGGDVPNARVKKKGRAAQLDVRRRASGNVEETLRWLLSGHSARGIGICGVGTLGKRTRFRGAVARVCYQSVVACTGWKYTCHAR